MVPFTGAAVPVFGSLVAQWSTLGLALLVLLCMHGMML